MPEKPICTAIVICDMVIEDKMTNNKTLVGLFNAITASELPIVFHRFFIFVTLTNTRGEIPVSFTISDPESQTVFKMEATIESIGPLAVIDLVVEVRDLPLQKAGVYMVDIQSCGEHLGNRRFHVFPPPKV